MSPENNTNTERKYAKCTVRKFGTNNKRARITEHIELNFYIIWSVIFYIWLIVSSETKDLAN
jgi:hypothetical protein